MLTSKGLICIYKSARLSILLFCLITLICASCLKRGDSPRELADGWCSLPLAAARTTSGLGPIDYNANYNGFLARMKPGETAILHAHFPHARYASVMVYDQDFLLLDSILDKDVEPLEGINPFLPGVDRSSDYLGEFEIKIVMGPLPADGIKEKNTLYAGLTHEGAPNNIAVVGYRIYLNDEGMSQADGHPQAVFGGVPPPRFVVVGQDGQTRCPDPAKSRLDYSRVLGALILKNLKNIINPTMGIGEYHSPPQWINNASADTQDELLFVPSPDTNYIMAPISNEYGELLVFRWKPARTPAETYRGGPFPDPGETDMRYFSLSFDYFDRTKTEKVFCEKTVADIEAPMLPDGTCQLVVGFGGSPRPESVPPEQWVGLEMEKGLAVVRNIVVNPDYPGYFWKLPPGTVPPEYDRYTPGGVYCSAREFEQDPDIGLRRAEKI